MQIKLLVDRRWGNGPYDFNVAGDIIEVDFSAGVQLIMDEQAVTIDGSILPKPAAAPEVPEIPEVPDKGGAG